MISTDPDNLMLEIRAAEELRKRIITNTTSLVRKYVSNWYRTDQRSGKPRPENMIFNFVASILPEIIFDNPAVKVSAKRTITHKPIAQFMEMALNGWIVDVDARTELELLAIDFLFCFAVAKVGLEPRSDYAGSKGGVGGRFTMDALTPFLIRIPPANIIIDAQCDNVNSARIVGHMFQRDLSDLQADERFDKAAVDGMTADDEKAVGRTAGERAFKDPGAANANVRGRVTLYEIYLPEIRQIGTLALSAQGKARWVRPLSDYHGPDEGPFVFFGVYSVPDQVYPLSPIAAMAEQDQELNAHAAAAAKEAATAKSLVLVDANQPELARQIERAENNSVITVKGLNGQNVLPVALGGTTEQRILYLNLLLQRTDRNSGQSEAARGKAQGVTATEAEIAHSSGDARTEFIHLKFRGGVKEALSRIGWYHFHDDAVVAHVNYQDPATGQESEGVFLGGQQPGQEDSSWTQFFLDIEPYSMRRVDPAVQQQQAQLTLALVVQIAPMIPQFPYVNWPAVLDMIGEANNLPDFSKTVLNAVGLQMIQAGVMPGQMGGLNPMAQQLPPGTNPQIQQATAGAPVGAMQPQRQLPAPGGGGGGVSPFLANLVNKSIANQAGSALGFGQPARAGA
jgi:hypothetical protein